MANVDKTHSIKRMAISGIIFGLFVLFIFNLSVLADSPNPQSGGLGLEGKISAPPPTQAPTITQPSNGAVFSNLPITVSGWCPKDLLIKVFRNNVFSGSTMCKNNSYSMQIDLFSAVNHLTAVGYDSLDQASPESNKVTVTYHDSVNAPSIENRVILTSNYARRGANPNELLTWPIIISGGTAPYAITVDWGDGSDNDIYTATTPGEFIIKHQLAQSGIYRVLIKAADKNDSIAYLQLVAIGNGEAKQVAGASATKTSAAGKTIVVWWPAAIAIPLIITTFWLGKRYEKQRVKKRLERGEHPFGD